MSVTLQTFNHTLCEFIDELSLTFDDVPQIKLYKAGLPALLAQDERAALEFFMDATRAHADKIMKKDSSLFEEDAIDLGMGLKISDLWHADGLDDDTRGAIWNYLSSLFILGMTIDSLDENMLSSIENLANQTAAKLKSKGSMDLGAMLPDLMQSVGGILGNQGMIDGASEPGFQNVLQSMLGGMDLTGLLKGADDTEEMEE